MLSLDYSDGLYEKICSILYVCEDESLLPPGMESTPGSVMRWMRRRIIPRNRMHADRLLSRIGPDTADTMGIIQISRGLSLNDSYWVAEDGFDGSFADYNLYDSPFALDAARMAFTGEGTIRPRTFVSTPELTTNGMLAKCWRRENGRICLYKGGSYGATNAGQEPYCEYYAAQIAEAMGIKHVRYNLCKRQGMLASVCELFTSKDVSYVPMWKVVHGDQFIDIINYLKSLGDEFYDGFADMMVFDALIYNTDRHYSNFGLLFDSHTNTPLEYAPLFDNGLSLFAHASGEDFKDIASYAKKKQSTLGMSFDENASILMTDRQRDMLRRLDGFTFMRHPRYNWPKERLYALEQFIRRRAAFLLAL